jgi:predicted DNA-binding ribbon-helix-helix protein
MIESKIQKHSVSLAGFRTSISLEDEFWAYLTDWASRANCTVGTLIKDIRVKYPQHNLSSACRVAVLEDARQAQAMARAA